MDIDRILTSDGSFLNGRRLLEALNSFWVNIYAQADRLTLETDANCQAFYRTYLRLVEFTLAAAKDQIKVFHASDWTALRLKESEKVVLSSRKYGDGLAYEVGSFTKYGDNPVASQTKFPAMENLVRGGSIFNRILVPSVSLRYGREFDVVDGWLRLATDPFNNPNIPVFNITNSTGQTIDREVVLWLSAGEWDEQDIWYRYGYALGIYMESSESYRRFISALWDSTVIGGSKASLSAALSAMTGIPFAEGLETVSRVFVYQGLTHVETERNLYSFKGQSLVQAGQTLVPGQNLSEGLQLTVLSEYGPLPELPFLTLGADMVDLTGSALTFPNDLVELQWMGYDGDGRLIVRFNVGGDQADVERYWQEVHARGVTSQTLAECLDTRQNKVGQPGPSDLPTHVNPFELIVRNVLHGNTYVIFIRPELFAQDVIGLAGFPYLRSYLPPYTTYLLHVAFPENSEYYDLSVCNDDQAFHRGVEPVIDSYDLAISQDRLTIGRRPGRCP